jgi:hypothetical protein
MVSVREIASWSAFHDFESAIGCCDQKHVSKSGREDDAYNRVVVLWNKEGARRLSHRLIYEVFANLDQCPKPVADLAADLRHRLGLGLPGGRSPS